ATVGSGGWSVAAGPADPGQPESRTTTPRARATMPDSYPDSRPRVAHGTGAFVTTRAATPTAGVSDLWVFLLSHSDRFQKLLSSYQRVGGRRTTLTSNLVDRVLHDPHAGAINVGRTIACNRSARSPLDPHPGPARAG